jgi:hypothetical protein
MPGTLTQTLTQTPEDARTRAVTWQESLTVTAERVDLAGDVTMSGPTSLEADGAEVALRADRASVAIDDASEPTEVEAVGTVRLTAEQRDEAGQLATSFDLRAERVVGLPRTGGFSVPVEGRLLIRDLRADEGRFTGAVALGWTTDLVYDPAANLTTARSGVTLVVQPADAMQFTINAERFLVTTDETADGPSVTGAEAVGEARLSSDALTMQAETLSYDATANTITATATGSRSVQLFDGDGRPRGQFRRAVYDVGQGRIVSVEDIQAGG